jgi:hypothetical protein
LRREWFDRDHYDVCKSTRAQAIRLGAVAISLRDMAAKLRGPRIIFTKPLSFTNTSQPKCLIGRGL